MKKIAVIAATGKAGSLIAQKALSHGHEVTAIVRNKERLKNQVTAVLEKDIFALTAEDLSGFDAIVLAHHAPAGQEEDYSKVAEKMIKILDSSESRLIIVGGASSLYLDENRDQRLLDVTQKDLPYYPTLLEMAKASLIYESSKLNFTFFSPAEFFDPEGLETNDYTITGDVLGYNKAGKSRISYADYAEAVVKMIEDGKYQHEHIGIYEN